MGNGISLLKNTQEQKTICYNMVYLKVYDEAHQYLNMTHYI